MEKADDALERLDIWGERRLEDVGLGALPAFVDVGKRELSLGRKEVVEAAFAHAGIGAHILRCSAA